MILVEACQNHNGRLDILNRIINDAAECGAWGVKIQSFFAEDLHPDWDVSKRPEMAEKELNWEAHRWFVKTCKEKGLVPVTTLNSKDKINNALEAGFDTVKVSSVDSDDKDLCNALTKNFRVIASTGGVDLSDVARPENPFWAVLHCNLSYPTYFGDANLRRIERMKWEFPLSLVGYSSHLDPTDSNCMVALKAAIYAFQAGLVEVHYTVLPREQVKDGAVSLDKRQLQDLCSFDVSPSDVGLPLLGMLYSPQKDAERELRARYKKRWK